MRVWNQVGNNDVDNQPSNPCAGSGLYKINPIWGVAAGIGPMTPSYTKIRKEHPLRSRSCWTGFMVGFKQTAQGLDQAGAAAGLFVIPARPVNGVQAPQA